MVAPDGPARTLRVCFGSPVVPVRFDTRKCDYIDVRDGHDALKEVAPAPPWHLWQGASIAAAFAPPFRRVISCRRPHGTAHVGVAFPLRQIDKISGCT
jgi:hypothetical protein